MSRRVSIRVLSRLLTALTVLLCLVDHQGRLRGASTPNTIIVNTANDVVANDGFCSLREAILAANSNSAFGDCAGGMPGLDQIEFDLGSGTPTILIDGLPLPAVIEPLTIRGNSGGATRIELNGFFAGENANGLTLQANGVLVRDLVINRFSGWGLEVAQGSSTTVQDCYIGTNSSGSAALPNGKGGIYALGSGVIGGNASSLGNVVSGNNGPGINIVSVTCCAPIEWVIRGNSIGTDSTGQLALPNTYGIYVSGYAYVTIGGPNAEDRNIVSGNSSYGIRIANAQGLTLQGNVIGLNKAGTSALGNGEAGLVLDNLPNGALIGGSQAGTGNVISGNSGVGLYLGSGYAPVVKIQGNYVGTDLSGSSAIGNHSYGMFLLSDTAIVGGEIAGSGNVIAGNGAVGILVQGAPRILGNRIGIGVNGSQLGNQGPGIATVWKATIGNDSGGGNIIAYNQGKGVTVTNVDNQVPISGNAIYGNASIGIDLGNPNPDGVTPNDPGDSDTGANTLQNFPVITTAAADGASLSIFGQINTTPNTTLKIEYFHSTTCDPSGYGQGERFIGSGVTTTNGSGDANLIATLPGFTATSGVITATATKLLSNVPTMTSEFSVCTSISQSAVPPTSPAPTLTSILPSTRLAGSAGFALAVFGTNFVARSTVNWNGSPRATSFVSDTELGVWIPSSDIPAGGTIPVTVVNPAPGGGTSNSRDFQIANPVPTLASISPSSINQGSPSFLLSVVGTNFLPVSLVRWNGASRPTTYLSSTELMAAISAMDVSSQGVANVTVFNPPPSGGVSGSMSFTILFVCGEITVNPAALPDGTVGSSYSETFTATGTNGGVMWTVSAGTLPNGVNLSSSGLLSGTPTISGTFNFTVRATDANNCHGERSYSVVAAIPAYEADVAPRPNGSGTLVVSDWVQVGRFSVGLDTPSPGSEAQRADCAPRSTLGDGHITVADWVQAGRYSVGLDPPTQAGGSTLISQALPTNRKWTGTGRAVQIATQTSTADNGVISVPVELTAQGGENGITFSLHYDASVLSYEGFEPGTNARSGAMFLENAAQAGRVGFGIVLRPGASYEAGARELVRVKFRVLDAFAVTTEVKTGGEPTPLGLVNAYAEDLPVRPVSVILSIGSRAIATTK